MLILRMPGMSWHNWQIHMYRYVMRMSYPSSSS